MASRRDAPAHREHARPGVGLVGALLALEIMHLLIGERPATAGRVLIVDMRTLEVRRHAVERDPRCPSCGA